MDIYRWIVPFHDAVAGAAAGVVGTVLGYPLDAVKSMMQVSNVSAVKACRNIYQTNGFSGFYRGMLSPLVALTVLNTVNFSSYNFFHRKFSNHYFAIPISAILVGPVASTISTPFELLKLQLQINRQAKHSKHVYSGSLDAALQITRQFGIKSLYVGHGINTAREMVFLGTYFTTYEYMKDFLHQHLSLFTSSGKLHIPIAGGIAGAFGWFVSFPLDLTKSRIQSENLAVSNRPSSLAILQDYFKTRGIRGLYSGVLPSIMRAFIVSSSRFTAYETVQQYFSK